MKKFAQLKKFFNKDITETLKKHKIVIPEYGEIIADGIVINLLAGYVQEAAESYANKGYKRLAERTENIYREMHSQLRMKGYFLCS